MSGVIEAESQDAARALLGRRDLVIKKLGKKSPFLPSPKVPARHLAHLVRQLSAFTGAGVPFVEALRILREESRSKTLREVIGEVADRIDHGEDVATAFSYRSDIFPPYFITIIRAATESADLSSALEFLGVYLERDIDTRRRVTTALLYPCIVFGLLVVSATAITVFVFPTLREFLVVLGVEPPLVANVLFAISEFLREYWPIIVLVIVALVLLLMAAMSTTRTRRPLQWTVLRIPVVRDVVTDSAVERISRIAAAMMRTNVALPVTLQLAADTTRNPFFREPLLKARGAIVEGHEMSASLRAKGSAFPVGAVRLIEVGEQTGSLQEQFEHMATYYAKELDYQVVRLNTIAEPTMIIILGVFIAFFGLTVIATFYGALGQLKQ